MNAQAITKDVAREGIRPQLSDYANTCRGSTWERARRELASPTNSIAGAVIKAVIELKSGVEPFTTSD